MRSRCSLEGCERGSWNAARRGSGSSLRPYGRWAARSGTEARDVERWTKEHAGALLTADRTYRVLGAFSYLSSSGRQEQPLPRRKAALALPSFVMPSFVMQRRHFRLDGRCQPACLTLHVQLLLHRDAAQRAPGARRTPPPPRFAPSPDAACGRVIIIPHQLPT